MKQTRSVTMTIRCALGCLDDVLLINTKIAEFNGTIDKPLLTARLQGNNPLILTATFQGVLAGYKIGYRISDDEFYSWLGGVIPAYR